MAVANGIQCVIYPYEGRSVYCSRIVGHVKCDYSSPSDRDCYIRVFHPLRGLSLVSLPFEKLLFLPLSFLFFFFFFFSRNIFFFPSCSRNKSRWESTQRRQFHSKDWRPMVRKLTRKHANCWRIRGVAGHSRLFTMKGARTWPHPMFIRLCCSSSRQSTMFLAHSYPPAQELLINFFTRRASFLSPVRSRMLHSRRICKRLPSPRS